MTRPLHQMRCGLSVSFSMYFQSTSNRLPTNCWSKAGAWDGVGRGGIGYWDGVGWGGWVGWDGVGWGGWVGSDGIGSDQMEWSGVGGMGWGDLSAGGRVGCMGLAWGACLGCCVSTASEMPASMRRCISLSAICSSCCRSNSDSARTSSASASSVPSCSPALHACCGGHASVGSPFDEPAVNRARDFSSRIISSSSAFRCATVPTRSSSFDDQRVAYSVQPSPSTLISTWCRRYSSFCASGRSRPLSSSSAFFTIAADVARCPPSFAHSL